MAKLHEFESKINFPIIILLKSDLALEISSGLVTKVYFETILDFHY